MFGGDLARRVLRIGTDPCLIARSFIEALNARDFAALRPLLAENLVYTDPSEQTIEGGEDFLFALCRVTESIPGIALQVDIYSRRGDRCLLTGRVVADDPMHHTPSLWDMCVQSGRLVSVHAYRRSNTLQLVQIVRAEKAAIRTVIQTPNPA